MSIEGFLPVDPIDANHHYQGLELFVKESAFNKSTTTDKLTMILYFRVPFVRLSRKPTIPVLLIARHPHGEPLMVDALPAT